MCISDPTVERKKKRPKKLENFHGYSTSIEHHPKTKEDDFVTAVIKKRFDQPDYQIYVAIQNVFLMSYKSKDPQ